MHNLSLGSIVVVVTMLFGGKPLRRRLASRMAPREMHMVVKRGSVTLGSIQTALRSDLAHVSRFVLQQSEAEAGAEEIQLTFINVSPSKFEAIYSRLACLHGVKRCQAEQPTKS